MSTEATTLTSALGSRVFFDGIFEAVEPLLPTIVQELGNPLVRPDCDACGHEIDLDEDASVVAFRYSEGTVVADLAHRACSDPVVIQLAEPAVAYGSLLRHLTRRRKQDVVPGAGFIAEMKTPNPVLVRALSQGGAETMRSWLPREVPTLRGALFSIWTDGDGQLVGSTVSESGFLLGPSKMKSTPRAPGSSD